MQKFLAAILLAAATSANRLPYETFEFRGKPYAIITNEKATWYDADAFCVGRHLNLVTIEDQAEFEYIRGQLVSRGLQNDHVWTGGTEIGVEDNYYWVDTGTPIELYNWDPSQTNDPNLRCMAYYKGLWRHHQCTTPAYYICESPTPTTLPPTTTTKIART